MSQAAAKYFRVINLPAQNAISDDLATPPQSFVYYPAAWCVAGLVPYLLLRNSGVDLLPERWTILHYVGAFLMVLGLSVTLACILRFATEGKGTLSPIDPTKKLVVNGLYRYSRNPMYVGVTSLLLGETLFWQSVNLAVYTAVVFVAFNIFITLHEEPRLRRVFGAEYEIYSGNVRRWL